MYDVSEVAGSHDGQGAAASVWDEPHVQTVNVINVGQGAAPTHLLAAPVGSELRSDSYAQAMDMP